ncbi:hypothetical protein Pelo_10470 [Pelomyxa schiedti]|nr:hypothetical protein Pelo_10470 [Pelomyxa schiedti]
MQLAACTDVNNNNNNNQPPNHPQQHQPQIDPAQLVPIAQPDQHLRQMGGDEHKSNCTCTRGASGTHNPDLQVDHNCMAPGEHKNKGEDEYENEECYLKSAATSITARGSKCKCDCSMNTSVAEQPPTSSAKTITTTTTRTTTSNHASSTVTNSSGPDSGTCHNTTITGLNTVMAIIVALTLYILFISKCL